MLTITGPRRRALVGYVENFFRLIAEDDWHSALSLIDRPNTYGISWTRELIERVVHDTFRPGSRFALEHPGPLSFTDPRSLPPPGPTWLNVGATRTGYEVEYPVPLCGDWTDLSAIMEFERSGPRHYLAVLHDLHVL